MQNKQLAAHIQKMIKTYREVNGFNLSDVGKLLEIADFASHEVGYYINKFHYIYTNIADNGGMPMLKAALCQLEYEAV